jgi:hypothetical protein
MALQAAEKLTTCALPLGIAQVLNNQSRFQALRPLYSLLKNPDRFLVLKGRRFSCAAKSNLIKRGVKPHQKRCPDTNLLPNCTTASL